MNDDCSLIKVEGVKKSFLLGKNSVEVLKKINFSLHKGEFVMIVGPSGSGKSTLLHLVAGLDDISLGRISVLGKDLTQLSDRALSLLRNQHIGFIFQFYHLLPELTAYENIFLPVLLSQHRLSKDALKRMDELFELMGLANRKLHRPQELSGGEQQRIAIARALMNRPQILLADEPTGNLDAANGEAILDLLENLRKTQGLSILMVTHNPEFLKRADRVLYLKDGTIQG
ncbi:MAG: ABC transporter ATP-binding protein [Chlamydiae bacterium]|nr:ABC transporter ATP-binding protein [Chlamydiota bacterium]MBI3278126.1 ABC transporter ATP-binding protein [Chlamydiota bacterium]